MMRAATALIRCDGPAAAHAHTDGDGGDAAAVGRRRGDSDRNDSGEDDEARQAPGQRLDDRRGLLIGEYREFDVAFVSARVDERVRIHAIGRGIRKFKPKDRKRSKISGVTSTRHQEPATGTRKSARLTRCKGDFKTRPQWSERSPCAAAACRTSLNMVLNPKTGFVEVWLKNPGKCGASTTTGVPHGVRGRSTPQNREAPKRRSARTASGKNKEDERDMNGGVTMDTTASTRASEPSELDDDAMEDQDDVDNAFEMNDQEEHDDPNEVGELGDRASSSDEPSLELPTRTLSQDLDPSSQRPSASLPEERPRALPSLSPTSSSPPSTSALLSSRPSFPETARALSSAPLVLASHAASTQQAPVRKPCRTRVSTSTGGGAASVSSSASSSTRPQDSRMTLKQAGRSERALRELQATTGFGQVEMSLRAHVVEILGDGVCLYRAVDASLATEIFHGVMKRSTMNDRAVWRLLQGINDVLVAKLPEMVATQLVDRNVLYRRYFGKAPVSLDPEQVLAALLGFISKTAKWPIGTTLPMSRWGSCEEIMACVWFLDEPVFVAHSWELNNDAMGFQLYYLAKRVDGERVMKVEHLTNDHGIAVIQGCLLQRQVPVVVVLEHLVCKKGHFKCLRFADEHYSATIRNKPSMDEIAAKVDVIRSALIPNTTERTQPRCAPPPRPLRTVRDLNSGVSIDEARDEASGQGDRCRESVCAPAQPDGSTSVGIQSIFPCLPSSTSTSTSSLLASRGARKCASSPVPAPSPSPLALASQMVRTPAAHRASAWKPSSTRRSGSARCDGVTDGREARKVTGKRTASGKMKMKRQSKMNEVMTEQDELDELGDEADTSYDRCLARPSRRPSRDTDRSSLVSTPSMAAQDQRPATTVGVGGARGSIGCSGSQFEAGDQHNGDQSCVHAQDDDEADEFGDELMDNGVGNDDDAVDQATAHESLLPVDEKRSRGVENRDASASAPAPLPSSFRRRISSPPDFVPPALACHAPLVSSATPLLLESPPEASEADRIAETPKLIPAVDTIARAKNVFRTTESPTSVDDHAERVFGKSVFTGCVEGARDGTADASDRGRESACASLPRDEPMGVIITGIQPPQPPRTVTDLNTGANGARRPRKGARPLKRFRRGEDDTTRVVDRTKTTSITGSRPRAGVGPQEKSANSSVLINRDTSQHHSPAAQKERGRGVGNPSIFLIPTAMRATTHEAIDRSSLRGADANGTSRGAEEVIAGSADGVVQPHGGPTVEVNSEVKVVSVTPAALIAAVKEIVEHAVAECRSSVQQITNACSKQEQIATQLASTYEAISALQLPSSGHEALTRALQAIEKRLNELIAAANDASERQSRVQHNVGHGTGPVGMEVDSVFDGDHEMQTCESPVASTAHTSGPVQMDVDDEQEFNAQCVVGATGLADGSSELMDTDMADCDNVDEALCAAVTKHLSVGGTRSQNTPVDADQDVHMEEVEAVEVSLKAFEARLEEEFTRAQAETFQRAFCHAQTTLETLKQKDDGSVWRALQALR